jgi:N-methylhydantoinase B
MPAKIIQRNRKPMKKVKVDTVTIDIIESALRNARFEMDTVLFRTAMSPGIREQHDEFPMIANLQGKMVVGQFGSFIWGFMQGYDGTVEEGDVFLTNDPYSCNGAISHQNDWLMLMPVYKDGRIIAWSAMFGHMTDVGGKVPGSLPTDARTVYEEGICVPPVKIIKGGKLQDDLLRVVLHNCRLPTWNYSDFNAIVAALRTAGIRCVEIAQRFGDDVFYSAMDGMLERNKRAMRQLIRRTVPETKQHFEDYICDDGLGMGPYRIACSMWREGDKCIFDFTGTDPQSISSINFLLNEEMFKMFAGVYMIMVFDPQILFNDGFYELMEVRIPPGTLLKPLKPAALSCRTHALGRIFDILGGLLGQGNPAFMCAAGFSDSPHFMYSGYDSKGSGTSSTRSPSVASLASRLATGRMVIRCGRRSPTCRTSFSRATFRCGSRPTRRFPIRAAQDVSAAAMGCASDTGSSSRARYRFTMTVGSPIHGASMADWPARAAARH